MGNTLRILTGLLVALAVGVPAAAQESMPLTWVAYTRVKPGKTQDWVKAGLKYDKAILDPLVAEGSILGWGYAVRATHRPDYEWNVLTWVNAPNWAGIGKWMNATMQAMQARSAEENAEVMAMFSELEEEGSHFDEVVRAGFANSNGERPNFIYAGQFTAKPGMGSTATALFEEAIGPIGEKLLAAGTLNGYGLHLQELHGQHQPDEGAWSHRAWYSFAELGALDALQAEFQAVQTSEFNARRAETFDFSAHHDDLLVVLHAEMAAPPE